MDKKQMLIDRYQNLGISVFQNAILDLFQQAIEQENMDEYGDTLRWKLILTGQETIYFEFWHVNNNVVRVMVWQGTRENRYAMNWWDECYPVLGG